MPGDVSNLANDDVRLELGAGTYALRWPRVGIGIGPCHAGVVSDGGLQATGRPGEWRTAPGTCNGSPGTWARWHPHDDAPSLALHLRERGPIVVVEVTLAPRSVTTVDAVTPLLGTTDVRYVSRLVDGYESWSYSGVRGREAGVSFWNAAFVDAAGRALALQALDGRRLTTRIANDGDELRVDCGATPALAKQPGTWGYRTGDSPALGLAVGPGTSLSSGPVAVGAAMDALTLVEDLAGLAGGAMEVRRWTGAPPRGWESWYQYGLFVSSDDILANARALRARYPDRPDLDLVQIDDGWQRTYGAWWPNERFPSDLGDLVHELGVLGCRAGLWVAPFRAQPGAPGLAQEHPEWMLRGADGAPIVDDRCGAWALDASHPDAREWIGALGAQIRSWGFEMVKVDFCYLGALEASRDDPQVTGIEAMRRGLRALADALGDGVYLLGCGLPSLPSVGLCHGNRVGHDLAMPRAHQALGHPVDERWTGFMGVRAGGRNLAARWAHIGRWYDADADVVMAWGTDGSDPAGYSIEEARALAIMAVCSGGPFLLADELGALGQEARAVLEHPGLLAMLGAQRLRPVDLLDRVDPDDVPQHAYAQGPGIARFWSVEHERGRALAIFNWDDEPATLPVPEEYRGTSELWTGTRIGDEADVPPRSVRVFLR